MPPATRTLVRRLPTISWLAATPTSAEISSSSSSSQSSSPSVSRESRPSRPRPSVLCDRASRARSRTSRPAVGSGTSTVGAGSGCDATPPRARRLEHRPRLEDRDRRRLVLELDRRPARRRQARAARRADRVGGAADDGEHGDDGEHDDEDGHVTVLADGPRRRRRGQAGTHRVEGMDPERRARHAGSFGAVSDDYDAARPTYPDEAVAWLAGTAPADVLDLGAGTGKLTERLVAAGHRVTAVDPSEGMLEQLRGRLPSVTALRAPAEQVPLPDAAFDVVTAAQAWHWFEPARRDAGVRTAAATRRSARAGLEPARRVARLGRRGVGSRSTATAAPACRCCPTAGPRPSREHRPVRPGRAGDVPPRAAAQPRRRAAAARLTQLARRAGRRTTRRRPAGRGAARPRHPPGQPRTARSLTIPYDVAVLSLAAIPLNASATAVCRP